MRPVMSTRVPAQLDKLVALVKADTALTDVAVYDGSPLQQPDEADVLVFAPSTPEQPGISVEYVQQPGLGAAYIEQASIVAVVSCWSGDDDMAARRQRVQQIVGRLQAIFAEHQVETACWDGIGFGAAGEWFLVPSETGSTAAFGFEILCRSAV